MECGYTLEAALCHFNFGLPFSLDQQLKEIAPLRTIFDPILVGKSKKLSLKMVDKCR